MSSLSSLITTLAILHTTYAFEWRRVLKINQNVQFPTAGSAYDWYSQIGTTYTTMSAEESYIATSGTLLTAEATNFKSLLIHDWAYGGIITVQKVRLSFCRTNEVQKNITFAFDASYTWLTWLALENIESSPWSDLTPSTDTQPVGIQSWWVWRNFAVWGSAETCDSDTAWFFVSISDAADCDWERGNNAAIWYSPLTTKALMRSFGQEAEAFIMEIYYEAIPTNAPTPIPTTNTNQPTNSPTGPPTFYPSLSPSTLPTNNPSRSPTTNPSSNPTQFPTTSPINEPSATPSDSPSKRPSHRPTDRPSSNTPPSNVQSSAPSTAPTFSPTPSPETRDDTLSDNNISLFLNSETMMLMVVLIGTSILICCVLCVLFFYYQVYAKENREIPEVELMSTSSVSHIVNTEQVNINCNVKDYTAPRDGPNVNVNVMSIPDIYGMGAINQMGQQMNQMAMNMNMAPVPFYMHQANGSQQINQMEAMGQAQGQGQGGDVAMDPEVMEPGEPGAAPSSDGAAQMLNMDPLPPPPILSLVDIVTKYED